jgi:hypothetical protein
MGQKRCLIVVSYLIVVSVLVLVTLPALLFAGKKPEGKQIAYDVVEEGTNMSYQNGDPDIVVIQDEVKFRDLHTRIHRIGTSKPTLPEVDFGTHFVVFLTYGEQPSAGYFIQVRSVAERDGTVVIRTLLKEPPQDSYQAQAITHPYLFVSVPRDGFSRVEWAGGVGEEFYSRPL